MITHEVALFILVGDQMYRRQAIIFASLGASLKMLKSHNMLPFVTWQRVGVSRLLATLLLRLMQPLLLPDHSLGQKWRWVGPASHRTK